MSTNVTNYGPPEIGSDPELNAMELCSADNILGNQTQPYTVSVTTSNGLCVIHWKAMKSNSTYDWVGMFHSIADAVNDPNGTVISPGDKSGWQWCCRGSEYTTSTKACKGLIAAYIDGSSPYHAVAFSEPL
jgi:hypothetical protein